MDTAKDKLFQRIIRSNLPMLCQSTDCNTSFLDILVQKNFISPHEKDVILCKRTKYDKCSEFYVKITQKGPKVYKALVNALRMTDQNYAADILVQHGGILIDDSLKLNDEEDEMNLTKSDSMDDNSMDFTSNTFNQLSLASPLLLAPLKRFPTETQPNIQTADSLSFSSVTANPASSNVEPKFGVFSKPDIPLSLESRPDLADYLAPYKLQSSPKGYALIINIISFDYKEDWFRNGASLDTEMMSKMFQDFGFLVFAIENVSASEFNLALDEFRERFNTNPVDCSIVCVMSHGDEGDNVYTRDRGVLNIKRDILEKFTNANCPQLIGKPKLFFFQYCRGDMTDRGTTVTDSAVFYRAMAYTPPTTIPTWTDMLVCYSTLEGYYAYRETTEGSWFIQILCQTFKEFGHLFDICDLLNLVAQRMKSVAGNEGEKQICPYTNIGFTKKFYFNKDT